MVIAEAKQLMLCSGSYKVAGIKTLDANPACQPDYCVTIPPLPKEMRDRSWDAIFLIHGIEHFYKWEAEELLRDCHEALAPGGLLVLEQPDIEVAALAMLGLIDPMTKEPERSGIWAIYGEPHKRDPLMGHKWGWTPKTLTAAVQAAGFRDVKTGKALAHKGVGDRDFRLEATK